MGKHLTAADVMDRIEAHGLANQLVINKLRERSEADPDFVIPHAFLERMSTGSPLTLLRLRYVDLEKYLGAELTQLLQQLTKVGKKKLNVKVVRDCYAAIYGHDLDAA